MAKKIDDDLKITKGSGNVFADIGLPNPEERLAKAHLVSTLDDLIVNRKISQRAAAEIIGLDPGDLSNLLNGRTKGYSLDRLLRFIRAFDRDVEIRIKEMPKSRKESRISVVAA